MRVATLCSQDFANVNTDIAAEVRETCPELDMRVIALAAHPFDYERKHDYDLSGGGRAVYDAAYDFYRSADWVIWADEPANETGSLYDPSFYHQWGWGVLDHPRLLIFHTGVAFRAKYDWYNRLDRECTLRQLCSPDLLRLANPDAVCLFGRPFRVDLPEIEALWDAREQSERLVVTHSPSDYGTKGTPIIRAAMERIKQRYPHVEYRELGGPVDQGKSLAHAELLQSRDRAHIHIDQFQPAIGNLAISPLETMARGIITLCTMNHIDAHVWQQWNMPREDCPAVDLSFPDCETAGQSAAEERVFSVVEKLCTSPLADLRRVGIQSARWIHQHLNPEAYVRFLQRKVFVEN